MIFVTHNYFYNYTRVICKIIWVFIYTLINTNKLIYSYKCNDNYICTSLIKQDQILFN